MVDNEKWEDNVLPMMGIVGAVGLVVCMILGVIMNNRQNNLENKLISLGEVEYRTVDTSDGIDYYIVDKDGKYYSVTFGQYQKADYAPIRLQVNDAEK
jgi:hypothetical protein